MGDGAKTETVPAEKRREAFSFSRAIGRTVYEVAVHFSRDGTETMADKVNRLIDRELEGM